jgi:hypothetical protein
MLTFTCSALLSVLLAQGVPPASPAPQTPPATAPATKVDKPGREFYVSWGYNGDNYTKSDMHFSQPGLGNDFRLLKVQAHDSKAWTDLFDHALTVPQYNVRAGYFWNEKWGVELAMDHIKWIVTQDQLVHMTGTLAGAPVDGDVVLSEAVLKYQLNNGANPVFVNLIRRFRLAGQHGRTGYLTFLAKAGGGFAVPHTENTVFGVPNEAGFQFFQGWNLDAVAAARVHLYKGLYFEFEEKFVYARYFGVNINQGTAGHTVKAAEFAFHFGWSFW